MRASDLPLDPAQVRVHFPAELRALRQWVLWKLEEREKGKKPTKVPYATSGSHAKSTDSATWGTLEEALAAHSGGKFTGVGFVFNGEGVVGVDLDHCRDADSGAIAPWARSILDSLHSYSELSPSGTGIHALVRGVLSGGGRKRLVKTKGAHPEAGVEIYDRSRYFTVTGRRLPEYPAGLVERQEDVDRLYASLDKKATKTGSPPGRPAPPASHLALLADDEVLRRAQAARNGGAFQRLWNGDTADYAGDDSAADLALCSHLAFWCGGNRDQMDRLFRRSGLYREKWERPDYRERTFAKALDGRTEFFEPGQHRDGDGDPDNPWPTPGWKVALQCAKEDMEPWPAPRPLPALEVEPPPLPGDLLPSALRPWLEDAAERISVPLEFVAMPGLVSLGAIVGRGCGIRPKRMDDWTVVPNLWGAIVSGPGRMKSAAASEGTRLARRLAANAAKEYQERMEANRQAIDVLDARRAGLKDRVKQLTRQGKDISGVEEELTAIDEKLSELCRPERRYTIADATTAKLAALLADNPRGLCLVRDELAALFMAMTRSGCEGDREFYLESWNGTGSFVVDRIGRGTIHVPALCLSVFGSIQPGKLRSFIEEATGTGAGADGLLQRLQLLVWPGNLGAFVNVDRHPDTVAREAAFKVFERLAGVIPAVEKDEDTGIPILRFAPDAQEMFDAWRAELEVRLRSQDLDATPAFAAHLAKYRSLIAALALLLHLAETAAAGEDPGPVPLRAVQRAGAFVDYLEIHARRVYAMEVHREAHAAHDLLRRLREGQVDSRTPVRDIQRRGWSGLSTQGAVVQALRLLEEHGWVRLVDDRRGAGAGRPSKRVLLHPDLRGGA